MSTVAAADTKTAAAAAAIDPCRALVAATPPPPIHKSLCRQKTLKQESFCFCFFFFCLYPNTKCLRPRTQQTPKSLLQCFLHAITNFPRRPFKLSANPPTKTSEKRTHKTEQILRNQKKLPKNSPQKTTNKQLPSPLNLFLLQSLS